MTAIATALRAGSRTSAALTALALGVALSGCAEMGDGLSKGFADPAKYELYDCKQLETERKRLAVAIAENQGLMAKAETGVAGAVVSELAYRNENIALRGQMTFANEAWRKNRCRESTPAPAPAAAAVAPPAAPAPPSRAGSAVY
jgi:hypothetical protein